MNYAMFEEIGAVPNIISSLKDELIKMQFHYAFEKCSANIGHCSVGIPTRGTIEQYNKIMNKLSYTGYSSKNIHDVLAKEEIELLGPDQYIEQNYSEWYKDDNYIPQE